MLFLLSTSSFSYVQIFLFFILGSATYEIAKGLGVYIKAKNRHEAQITWCPTVSLWQAFLLLAMLQYFLALEASASSNTPISSSEMVIHIISVMTFALMTTLIIPDLNAPDVQDQLKQGTPGYELKDFYRRHRKALALAGLTFMICAIINFGSLHGSYESYLTTRFPFHVLYLLIISVMYFSDPQKPNFTLLHRCVAALAVFLEVAIIVFAM